MIGIFFVIWARPAFAKTSRWLLAVMLPFYLFAVGTGMRWKKGKVENLLCRNCRRSGEFFGETVDVYWKQADYQIDESLIFWATFPWMWPVAARLWWWWHPWPPWLDCTFPIDALGRKMGSDWDPSNPVFVMEIRGSSGRSHGERCLLFQETLISTMRRRGCFWPKDSNKNRLGPLKEGTVCNVLQQCSLKVKTS